MTMRELVDKLNAATELYDAGTPTMTDTEWDKMYFQLVDMERDAEPLPDSPTQKIHFTEVSALEKSTHKYVMPSLEKTKKTDTVKSFISNKDSLFMLKMDGLTCALTYENGELIKGETRGNGLVGEDITHNVKVMSNIPKRINYKERLIVFGEVICDYETFEEFSEDYANPRNFASGSIRLLNSRESHSRKLSFVAWEVAEGFSESNSLAYNLGNLQMLGFTVVPGRVIEATDDTAEVDEVINSLKEEAKELNYPIDGIVIKWDNLKIYRDAGSTAHHPKGALAYKFYDEEYETELITIEYDVSRNGVLTPVAVFEPVDTGDSIIEKASLHNISVLESILVEPHVGQSIRVFKANDIIPQVSYGARIEHFGGAGFIIDYPRTCPICGGDTEIQVSDAGIKTLVCANPQCSGKLINIIDHFVGKAGIDVKGLSKATIEKLIEAGWLNCRADVFELGKHKGEWQKMPGFGVASVQNILTAISNSQNTYPEAFLSGLGIPLIGRTVSKQLFERFDSYADFRAYGQRKLGYSDIPGIGPEMSRALTTYDYTEADMMVEKYIHFKQKEVVEKADSLAGKTLVITGKLSRRRDDIKADIERAGGKVTGSVSGKTSYLVCNDKNSTTGKSGDAKRLGVPVITEEELMALIK